MAKASPELIKILKDTALRIKHSHDYQWGHMGSCNCGFLAQEITQLRKDEIHSLAMERHGDWSEQLNDYCPTSGLWIDVIINLILAAGFDPSDLQKLERLSDHRVLALLPDNKRILRHNKKEDVIIYLNTWAILLEEELLDNIKSCFTTPRNYLSKGRRNKIQSLGWFS